ncbi:hypothetical protein NQ318_017502 [Aromia moschata]|uniref:Uncharacterized protein n=1 Tax=Aromia moschata TaxID=1265417 RepID=A0AAV8XQN5_9CUCU|nr:hypothetical protein NQ318_017502 [Aromia moschata]
MCNTDADDVNTSNTQNNNRPTLVMTDLFLVINIKYYQAVSKMRHWCSVEFKNSSSISSIIECTRLCCTIAAAVASN